MPLNCCLTVFQLEKPLKLFRPHEVCGKEKVQHISTKKNSKLFCFVSSSWQGKERQEDQYLLNPKIVYPCE